MQAHRWLLVGMLHWLGHGRATEAYLSSVCIIYGSCLIIFPATATQSQALVDLAWAGSVKYFAWSMLCVGVISMCGVIANINAFPGSRIIRIIGAIFGAWIYAWFVSKFALVAFPLNLGAVFAAVAVPLCLRTVGMAYLNLPRPGMPGAL